MRTLSKVAVLLLLAGCVADAPDGPPEASAPGAEPRASSGGGPVPAETPDAGADSAPQTPGTGLFVALEGEGLRVFEGSTGSDRPLPFGMPSADATAALTAALGTAPVERGEVADCAAAYARWDAGLTVWFANDRFAGWAVGPGSRLTTVDGLGPGTTRFELESARDPVLTRSSLGEEFTVGGLAGLLDSDAADARIRHLWSGHTCIAR